MTRPRRPPGQLRAISALGWRQGQLQAVAWDNAAGVALKLCSLLAESSGIKVGPPSLLSHLRISTYGMLSEAACASMHSLSIS
jgi:hypothetical protein